jgi:hypothetical protein
MDSPSEQQQPVVDYHAARNGTMATVSGAAIFGEIIVWILTDLFKIDVPPSIVIAIPAALGIAGSFIVHTGSFIIDRLAPLRIPMVDRASPPPNSSTPPAPMVNRVPAPRAPLG